MQINLRLVMPHTENSMIENLRILIVAHKKYKFVMLIKVKILLALESSVTQSTWNKMKELLPAYRLLKWYYCKIESNIISYKYNSSYWRVCESNKCILSNDSHPHILRYLQRLDIS